MYITINAPEFTIEVMRAEWAEDDSLSAVEVNAYADAEYAYLINRTGEALRGWSYTGQGFTGPVSTARNAITDILQLMSDASDYVLANVGVIKAELVEALAVEAAQRAVRGES